MATFVHQEMSYMLVIFFYNTPDITTEVLRTPQEERQQHSVDCLLVINEVDWLNLDVSHLKYVKWMRHLLGTCCIKGPWYKPEKVLFFVSAKLFSCIPSFTTTNLEPQAFESRHARLRNILLRGVKRVCSNHRTPNTKVVKLCWRNGI